MAAFFSSAEPILNGVSVLAINLFAWLFDVLTSFDCAGGFGIAEGAIFRYQSILISDTTSPLATGRIWGAVISSVIQCA